VGSDVRILVAPQEFKGSLSAVEAANAIAAGIRRALPAAEPVVLPLSDGGPGFVDALHAAIGGRLVTVPTHDAVGRSRMGVFLLAEDGTAYIEAAQANALSHLASRELAPLTSTTFGVGELLQAALDRSPGRVVAGVGGSATNDGGAGMAQALGARLLDASVHELRPGGAALSRLARVEWSAPDLPEVIVATDVTNPLLGPNGATAIFGPQKGASASDVEVLEAALAHFADVIAKDLGIDVRNVPGSGAAGGLAAGLIAFLGARVESGFDLVAVACGFHEHLAIADLVITGEGSFDAQSLHGKTTGRVIAAAEAAGKPWLVLAGRAAPGTGAISLSEVAQPGDDPMADAATLLERLAAKAIRERG
jgi:glycerate kinase